MPSYGRIMYDGAVCHIMQRGNNKQRIFAEEDAREKILALLGEYKRKFSFELYNYCIMSNHMHILIKIFKRHELPKLMQGVFQSFRFYYRRKHKYYGYLYQGRYKSKIIEKDSYLLDCARYIERNPIRAHMVDDPAKYRWSSYLFYADGHKSDIITKNPLYLALGNEAITRQEEYKEYVLTPRSYEDIIDKEFKFR